MNNLKNKTGSTNDSFYQELEDEERGSQTSSCLTLIIFCMIIYAGLIFLFWRTSPWFWQIPDRAAFIRNSIKLPSGNKVYNDIKKQTDDRSKNIIKNLKNSTGQSIDNKIQD